MANLGSVEKAAEMSGKSVRSIWRYVAKLEARGVLVSYDVPGLNRTAIDLDLVAPDRLHHGHELDGDLRRGPDRHRDADRVVALLAEVDRNHDSLEHLSSTPLGSMPSRHD